MKLDDVVNLLKDICGTENLSFHRRRGSAFVKIKYRGLDFVSLLSPRRGVCLCFTDFSRSDFNMSSFLVEEEDCKEIFELILNARIKQNVWSDCCG